VVWMQGVAKEEIFHLGRVCQEFLSSLDCAKYDGPTKVKPAHAKPAHAAPGYGKRNWYVLPLGIFLILSKKSVAVISCGHCGLMATSHFFSATFLM